MVSWIFRTLLDLPRPHLWTKQCEASQRRKYQSYFSLVLKKWEWLFHGKKFEVSNRTKTAYYKSAYLDSVLKSRGITLPTKICLVKALFFPVVIYGCESWSIKKAECQSHERLKIDGWLASPFQWMWIWVNSGSWWSAGRPGVLPSVGSQRVGHDWAELMIFPVAMDRCDSWIIKKAES